jgi:CBS domain-containing protein
LREASQRLVKACSGIVVVYATPEGEVTGVLTLHDLLRAQQTAVDAVTTDSI